VTKEGADAPHYQCVPNFSTSDPDSVARIAEAITNTPGARLVDWSADIDHNRCVMTILGGAEAVLAASFAGAEQAMRLIDLQAHTGVHPRTGALDVLPFVPLRNANRADVITLAHRSGQALAERLALPVYFYEWAARPGRNGALPALRRGGFEAFASLPLIGVRAPDIAPKIQDNSPNQELRSGANTTQENAAYAHPTAGIAIVGARAPLVAYNINLNTPDVEIARRIARLIRTERERLPELAGVRALGLYLASQNRAQVSMNLTCPDETPLPAVFHFVSEAAARLGAVAMESEIIGVIPLQSLGGELPDNFRWHTYKPTQLLETWLE